MKKSLETYLMILIDEIQKMLYQFIMKINVSLTIVEHLDTRFKSVVATIVFSMSKMKLFHQQIIINESNGSQWEPVLPHPGR